LHDIIPPEHVDAFNRVGQVGWTFIKDQIFTSKYLEAKLDKMQANLHEMEAMEEQ